MRGVLRVLGRLALWLIVLVAGFAAAVIFAVLVSAEDSDQLVGAIVMLAVALLVVAGAIWGLRRTRRLWPEKGDRSRALSEARERLRAGEPLVLRPSRRRGVGLLATSIALWRTDRSGAAAGAGTSGSDLHAARAERQHRRARRGLLVGLAFGYAFERRRADDDRPAMRSPAVSRSSRSRAR